MSKSCVSMETEQRTIPIPIYPLLLSLLRIRGGRGGDRMVCGFTTTCAISAYLTTNLVSSYLVHGEVY
jgi:hypothetical protein